MALSTPHGGTLINRWNEEYNYENIQKSLQLDKMSLSDLELIGNGAYSPIEGFLSEQDYQSVVSNMRLDSRLCLEYSNNIADFIRRSGYDFKW